MSAAISTTPNPHDTSLDTNKSKRYFFGLGKKKSEPLSPLSESESTPKTASEAPPQLPALISIPPMGTSLPPPAVAPPPMLVTTPPKTPARSPHSPSSPITASRPATAPYPTPPPTRLSTSSSQIFERNVQEHPNSANIPVPTSPAIPAHIQTDNHIPPVLEASSLAITDRDCSVDEVHIVMHAAHQPAVGSSGYAPAATTYEDASDTNATADKRRLSFISFADVVQAEQSLNTTSSSRGSPVQSPIDLVALRRSPSPIRPGSSGRAVEERGELTIETMRQALRKTGSGDLGR